MAIARTDNRPAKVATRWTPKQRHFQEWLAFPRHLRQPQYQQELAKELDVSEGTLVNWKKIPGFQDAVYDALRDDVRSSVPEVLDTLKTQAINFGKIDAIRDLLAIAGFYEPQKQAGRMGMEFEDSEGRVVRFVMEMGSE